MSNANDEASEQDRPGRGGRFAGRGRPAPTDPIQRKVRRPIPEFTGLPVPTGDTSADPRYSEFLPVALQIVCTPPSRGRRLLAYAVCGVVTAALFWAIFGTLRLFAIAPGQIEARGGSQVVEPLESGPISAIPVQNGSHVEKGSVVLQVDPTSAAAAKTIIESKLANARADALRGSTAARLAAAKVIDKAATLAWPAEIPADVRARQESTLHADLAQLAAVLADLDAKLQTQQAARQKFVDNITAQKTLIESRTKRTAMHETLAQQGWDSRAMVLQSMESLRQDQVNLATYEGSLKEAEAAIPVIENQARQARQNFIADNVDAAATATRQIADLEQELKKADLTLANLSMRAPVAGVVQNLAVTNIGQTVKPGENLLQIVPDGAALDIQAYVLNTDIGFVAVGQPVTIKIDTFPYTRYGTIEGRVTRVGADAISGKTAMIQQKNDTFTPAKGSLSVTQASQQMKDLVFPVTIEPNRSTIRVEGRDAPLTAGMSVVVEIQTQRQRAIDYILYPLTRAFKGKPQA